MFTVIKSIFYGVKPYINDVWYNRSLWIQEQVFPIVFDNNVYIYPKEGNYVVMGVKKNGRKIYYKIIKTWGTSGSDWHSASDAINCNLKFSHIGK